MEGNISIVVYTKKSSAQILGVKKGSTDGEIQELKLSKDASWEEKWTSDAKQATKSVTQFEKTFSIEFNFVEPRPMKFVVIDNKSKKVLGAHLTYLSDIATSEQVYCVKSYAWNQ